MKDRPDYPEPCRECDEDLPHERTKGQRKTTCDACGYASHWQRARVVTGGSAAEEVETLGAKLVLAQTFFVTDDGGEYQCHEPQDCTCPTHVGLKSDVVRLTFCCYSPSRYDYKRRRG